ncbi:MAG: glycosyltransferase [Deltaproteobacteria bacterium]|nr:glycosyltransferase [Deltaproteobacteria bacterium]
MGTIDIVEPTLISEAGHCHSFVESVCSARREGEDGITVYAGSRALLPRIRAMGIRVVPYFHRRIRRPEAFLLYRKLLREPGRIFIPTAGRADLTMLSLASGRSIPPGKAFLYFHWVKPDPSKRDFFRNASRKQPNLTVMGPTESVVGVFRECGFPDVRIVPYPGSPASAETAGADGEFRHVLYAGAARRDKGFPAVVDFVRSVGESGPDIPLAVQASPDHYGKFDEGIPAEVDRLRKSSAARLAILPETLDAGEYRALFAGAIVLQPYSREDFADRISGVTLDALEAGAPVIATAGTWMARTAVRFGAGVALEDSSPASILSAVEAVRAEYPRFRRNALQAGSVLRKEHDARQLLEILLSKDGTTP